MAPRLSCLLVLTLACGSPVTAPPDPASRFPPALQNASFLLEVHTDGRASVVSLPAASAGAPLLDSSVAELAIENVVVGVRGEGRPGWRPVMLDLRVRNRTTGALLVSPNFRISTPADRLLLIPLESWAPPSPGEVTVVDGTEVTVDLPNQGAVRPAPTWSGPPLAFFGEAVTCHAIDDRCRPYETLPAPLQPGTASPAVRLTFELEPGVHTFRVRLVLAGTSE